ncbi:MAG TPA: DUF1810 domain-containing protein [Steroidobacteraceae bacterium]|nr:DUF1810 domain-containing protein [Steroidobacteraceae bacterium]
MSADPYHLQRFVDAQRAVYAQAEAELRAGCKQSHWMWFIFPQIRGLGNSATAQKFAISSLDEAEAYLQHTLLGPRLRECTRLVTDLDGKSIEAILGHPDDLKFHSSMTLFAHAGVDNRIFVDAIKKYFGARFDDATIARL